MPLTEPLSVFVEPELGIALRRLSAKNHRSLSAELRASLWATVEASLTDERAAGNGPLVEAQPTQAARHDGP